mgnify:CR=1 FL=1
MSEKKIRVGIVGATGYTGAELLRILAAHPAVEIACITARTEVGKAVSELYAHLRGVVDLAFVALDDEALLQCDVVFFATPHGVCMAQAQRLIDAGIKIIDFSGDFRLKDTASFERWYGMAHSAPELLKQAVYGLPELQRDKIRHARLIANPGCYPTAVQLGFKPLLAHDLVETYPLIADVKSGVSGAGRAAKVANLFSEMGESFQAYAASGHRHQPEIEQELSKIAEKELAITFVPHLLPMIRGIEATLYAVLKDPHVDLQQLYVDTYANEPFVDVLPAGEHPSTRSVRGSNMVRMAVHRSVDQRMAVITVVEDNLVKGAAGQAVQCMNIVCGLPETLGLQHIALMP